MRNPITAAILAALVGAGGISAPIQIVAAAGQSVQADPEANLLMLARPFDTRNALSAHAPFSLQAPVGGSLHLLQFTGPIRQQWLDALSSRGVRPLQYIATNGYVVWADDSGRAQIEALRQNESYIQFSAPFHGYMKVEPGLAARIEGNGNPSSEVDITVQMYRHDGADATQKFVEDRALMPVGNLGPMGNGKLELQWHPQLQFQNLKLRVRLGDIAAIADRQDVVAVLPQNVMKMMDEKQDVILTGVIPPPAVAPAPNYISWLTARGFSTDPTQYPIVDVTDSPIHEGGTGPTVVATADQMLHVGGVAANPSRVAYFNNCSASATNTVGAVDGHGALNGGVVAG
jgi:hypothetical protein